MVPTFTLASTGNHSKLSFMKTTQIFPEKAVSCKFVAVSTDSKLPQIISASKLCELKTDYNV
jgi:hypothetical protein